jgi:tRNA(fMet)-specific endonuclease VapC
LVQVERFAAGRAVVSCDLDVAREYGRLKQRLKEKGRPIPENDIWIAAAAKHHGMVLVTRDGHFNEVDDLQFPWADLSRASAAAISGGATFTDSASV